MNTKTTKFLAVVAILAMAFAGFATISADQADAATVTKNVDSVPVTFEPALGGTVIGSTITFVGTTPAVAATGAVSSLGFGNYNFAEISLAPTTAMGITKIVVTDSAYQAVYGEDVSNGVTKEGSVYKYTVTSTTAITSLVIPVPKDGTTVEVQMYTGSDYATLSKDIILDCTYAYTQITLGTATTAHSVGYDSATSVSYWSYESTTLTLSNYYGNEIFKGAGSGLTVELKGTSTLGMEVADDVAVTAKQVYAAISDAAAVTVQGSGNLNIYIEVNDNVDVNAAGQIDGIYAGTDVTITMTGKLKIVAEGCIEKSSKLWSDGLCASVVGIFAMGDFVIGSESNIMNLNIEVCPTDQYAIGLYSHGTGSSTASTIYMSGSVTGGCKAILQETDALSIYGGDIDLEANERALQSSGLLTIGATSVDVSISDIEGYGLGSNEVYGLVVKAGLTINQSTIVNTQGLWLRNTTGDVSVAGVLNVSGDYEKNAGCTTTAGQYAGMYSERTAILTTYNAVPSASAYILLVKDLEGNMPDVVGNINILDADGDKVREVFASGDVVANLTSTKLATSYSTEAIFNIGAVTTGQTEIVVPTFKTVVLNIGTSLTAPSGSSTTIKCGSNAFNFANAAPLKGTITISKDAIIFDTVGATTITAVYGNVVLAGTNSAAVNMTGDDEKMGTLTIADGAVIGYALTTTDLNVVIPADATLSTSVANTVASTGSQAVAFDVAGTLVSTADTAKFTLPAKATLTVTGSIAATTADNADFFVLVASSTADFEKGTLGYLSTTYTNKAGITVGSSSVSGAGVTGFGIATSSLSAVTVSGTISQKDSQTATAVLTGVSAKDLVIGENVAAEAAGLTVSKTTLTVKGTLKADTTSTDLIVGSAIAAGTLVVEGYLWSGTASADQTAYANVAGISLAIEYQGAANAISYLTGYTLTAVEYPADTGAYVPQISGTLTKVIPARSTYANDLEITVPKSGSLYPVDAFELGTGTGLIFTGDASDPAAIKGKVSSGGNTISFDVKAGGTSENLTISAGSLIVAGTMQKATGATSMKVESGDSVKFGALTTGTAVVAIDAGTVTLTGTLDATGGKVTLGAGATLDVNSQTVTTPANVTIKGTVENYNGTDAFKFSEGAVYETGGYHYKVYKGTFGDTTYLYAIGTKIYEFIGEAVVTSETIDVKLGTIWNESGTPQAATILSLGNSILDTSKDLVTAGTVTGAITQVVKLTADVTKSNTSSLDIVIEPFEFTLTYDVNGGTWADSDETGIVVYEIGSTSTKFSSIASPVATRAAHDFVGWQKLGQKGVYMDFEAAVYQYAQDIESSSQTVIAVWSSIADKQFTVTFDSNGGSAVDSQTVYGYDTVEEPIEPTKDGYEFVGWYTDAKLTTLYDFKLPVMEAFTLYAGWEKEDAATSVAVAVKVTSTGIKVTVSGDDDKTVSEGTLTVRYWYYVLDEGTPATYSKTMDAVTFQGGSVVCSKSITLSGEEHFSTFAYITVTYNADGVTGNSGLIMFKVTA